MSGFLDIIVTVLHIKRTLETTSRIDNSHFLCITTLYSLRGQLHCMLNHESNIKKISPFACRLVLNWDTLFFFPSCLFPHLSSWCQFVFGFQSILKFFWCLWCFCQEHTCSNLHWSSLCANYFKKNIFFKIKEEGLYFLRKLSGYGMVVSVLMLRVNFSWNDHLQAPEYGSLLFFFLLKSFFKPFYKMEILIKTYK